MGLKLIEDFSKCLQAPSFIFGVSMQSLQVHKAIAGLVLFLMMMSVTSNFFAEVYIILTTQKYDT